MMFLAVFVLQALGLAQEILHVLLAVLEDGLTLTLLLVHNVMQGLYQNQIIVDVILVLLVNFLIKEMQHVPLVVLECGLS